VFDILHLRRLFVELDLYPITTPGVVVVVVGGGGGGGGGVGVGTG